MDYSKSSRKTILSDYEHNPLIRLVFACGAGYIMLHLAKIVIFMWGQVPVMESTQFFYDKILVHFGIQPLEGMLRRPWTILTYMFTGLGFFKLFTSMVWLVVFGNVIQNLIGKSEVVPLFFFSNILGGLAFILLQTAFPLTGQASLFVGADAGIFGFAIGALTLAPKYKLYFTQNLAIPLWILVVIYLVMNVVVLSGTQNYPLIGLLVTGALSGFVFIKLVQSGMRIGVWSNAFFKRITGSFMPAKKGVLEDKEVIHHDIDAILDKINDRGLRSLTKSERDFLQQHK
ncbi:hypothetical protein DBR32_15300 [Taibaiella sp. KBW10]|uniref:rhomboid family intramembrane serine protease n=1 Tax=Taibaiella sp. KBW10 TaxID=2153357 RepID=UPI000F598407|nr:rhomboid family intramembrane serine protease [Taibaiella sp. KBW10]RQO29700.1 hypothetical protein DBR32_15300 [Taibaiella sp. KBW10]